MLCTLCASLMHGEDLFGTERFIGIEAGYSEVQGNHPTDTSDHGNFGFRLGSQNEEWRTTIGIDIYESKKHALERGFFSLDYFFMNTDEYKSVPITPYFGINIGYMNFEGVGVDENGWLYGGQAGLKFSFIDSVDIDLGYRFSLGSPDALDHAGDIFMGINFKY